MKVFVTRYEHKHGSDLTVFATQDLAIKAQAGIARDWWNEREDQSTPDDHSTLSDEEVIEAYFTADNEEEFFTIEELPVIGEAG